MILQTNPSLERLLLVLLLLKRTNRYLLPHQRWLRRNPIRPHPPTSRSSRLLLKATNLSRLRLSHHPTPTMVDQDDSPIHSKVSLLSPSPSACVLLSWPGPATLPQPGRPHPSTWSMYRCKSTLSLSECHAPITPCHLREREQRTHTSPLYCHFLPTSLAYT